MARLLSTLKHRVPKQSRISEERLTALLPFCCPMHLLRLAKQISGVAFALFAWVTAGCT